MTLMTLIQMLGNLTKMYMHVLSEYISTYFIRYKTGIRHVFWLQVVLKFGIGIHSIRKRFSENSLIADKRLFITYIGN